MSEPALDAALFLNRFTLGAFFVLARFRFFYDPSRNKGDRFLCVSRRESLTHKMAYCGLKTKPMMWAYITAAIEVSTGMALLVGLLTQLAGVGILFLLAVATRCTARTKVMEQNPVDKIDYAACYLWRVEGLYIAQAVIVVLAGPGGWSLDAWLS